ncbi:MAG TPA: bifunctional glutamate N-acetyltransferase/amino-acid acetyltransferase ArgJ [Opitutales bacterium]|jgi:glutamate N-acetyltransferase/amino-acid N-acetyltransferase|nr:bifunctional glutamate N-acetyltransferase/amino-acid acetyltransferase ArgJ [Opitutales bacterium]
MPIEFQDDSAGVSDAMGFATSAVACDIREKNTERLDLALVCSAAPCTGAGVFTRNDVKAAPVRVCREILDSGKPLHGFVANSGNANACTGDQGLVDAQAMSERAAQAAKLPHNSILVCSTGRIGRAMPMPRILAGIDQAAAALVATPAESRRAAEAILTSDTRPKTCTARFTWQGKKVTVAAMAKGAGMIQPNMATMLAFLCTDAAAPTALLREVITTATQRTFNAITVDGDMSTNDTVLVLANGASGVNLATAPAEVRALFAEAVEKVCAQLAEKIVGDGEKITKVVEILVRGAHNDESAERIARAIGNSLLVKSSWFGEDPNWGRILDAAGAARTGLVEEKLDLFYDDTSVLLHGMAQNQHLARWKEIVRQPRFRIALELRQGTGAYRLLASDLTDGYVNYNKSE